MRLRYLGLVASAAGLLCAGVLATWATTVPRCGGTTLRDVVVRYLHSERDPVPAGMRYVRMAGYDGTPVYEVVLVGHFAAALESRPSRAAVPTGTTLTLDVDARTGGIDGVSLSTRPAPHLTKFGRVRAVPL